MDVTKIKSESNISSSVIEQNIKKSATSLFRAIGSKAIAKKIGHENHSCKDVMEQKLDSMIINKLAVNRLTQLEFEILELDSVIPPEDIIDWDNLDILKLLVRVLARQK